jgi:hypothetical protein
MVPLWQHGATMIYFQHFQANRRHRNLPLHQKQPTRPLLALLRSPSRCKPQQAAPRRLPPRLWPRLHRLHPSEPRPPYLPKMSSMLYCLLSFFFSFFTLLSLPSACIQLITPFTRRTVPVQFTPQGVLRWQQALEKCIAELSSGTTYFSTFIKPKLARVPAADRDMVVNSLFISDVVRNYVVGSF